MIETDVRHGVVEMPSIPKCEHQECFSLILYLGCIQLFFAEKQNFCPGKIVNWKSFYKNAPLQNR